MRANDSINSVVRYQRKQNRHQKLNYEVSITAAAAVGIVLLSAVCRQPDQQQEQTEEKRQLYRTYKISIIDTASRVQQATKRGN